MQNNTNDTLNAPDTHDSQLTRRARRERRTGRRRLIALGALSAAALVIGTGFSVQSAVGAQDRMNATAALAQGGARDHDQLSAYTAIAAARVQRSAHDTLNAANVTLAAASGKVDTARLSASIASLGASSTLPISEVVDLTNRTRQAIDQTQAATVAFDQAAAAKAAAIAAADTPDGARAVARDLAASRYGWGDGQFQCLNSLWQKESGWSYTAQNSSSGAAGIPQALPGSKMATAGADWESNAATQISWGLDYIARSYGTPCSAWSHSQSLNWY